MNLDVVTRSVTIGTDNYAEYLTNGIIKLRKAPDAEYVWIAKNGTLLHLGVDYLQDDKQSPGMVIDVVAHDSLERSIPIAQ